MRRQERIERRRSRPPGTATFLQQDPRTVRRRDLGRLSARYPEATRNPAARFPKNCYPKEGCGQALGEEGPRIESVQPIDKGSRVRGTRLTDRSVANIVKTYAGRAGFDASLFSGHSLRAGFLTSAAGKGASIFKMMDVSRHKSVDTLRGYVRDAELFKDHAGAGLL
jgi:integrase